MKVLVCTTSFSSGATGSARFAQSLTALGQSWNGYEASVISEDVEENQEARRFSVKLSTLATNGVLGYWAKSRDYAKAAQEFIQENPVDVIYFNNSWLARHFIKKSPDVPVVVSIRDDNAILASRNRLTAIPGYLVRRSLERRAAKSAEAVITNSPYLRDLIAVQYGIEHTNIRSYPPVYTNYSALAYSPLALTPEEPIRVVFVKNDLYRGRLKTLIGALGSLGEFTFELTVVGPAKTELDKFVSTLTRYSNLEIKGHGAEQRHDALLELLSSNHIFCTPAIREAFGVTNIEALACGLRLVYYPTGGIPEQLSNYGFVIEDYHIEGVRNAIRKAILMRSDQWEAQWTRARKWICEEYQEKIVSAEIGMLLDSLASSRKAE